MELRAGYKQTEVGVIPESWIPTSIGDKALKVGSGITPTGGDKVYKREGRPFLRSQNVGWGNLLLDDIAFIDEATHETFKSTEISADDVFLNITGASIGRSALADRRVERGNVNQHVCIIRAEKEKLHPSFLNYFLLSSGGQRQIDSFQTGGNRQGLNFAQIRSFGLPLPPIGEQRAIATALSDVDALLAKIDQLIAKKRDLKQAAMQQLLTGQTRLPGLSGEWEVKQLGNLANVAKGRGLSKGQLAGSGANQCILYGELFTTYERVIKSVVSKTNSAEGFLGLRGDVLLPGSTTTKGIDLAVASALLADDILLGGDINVVRTKNASGYDPVFMANLLTHTQRLAIADLAQGSTIIHLYGRNLLDLTLKLPLISEQTAIAKVLSDMDAELAALETRRNKTRTLKQGMMQALLTGRIRLIAGN
jgi:type I restriction enzyme S subunit